MCRFKGLRQQKIQEEIDMKKLLVILFALALVFSFTAPVMATDVSFDGSYRIRGWLDSNSALSENSTSNAYYDQRFRLGTVFQVAEGLKVTVRFDALDGTWGTQDMRNPIGTVVGLGVPDGSPLTPPATTFVAGASDTSQSNLQFDMAYVSFMTGIGQVEAGYMSDGTWGTGFGNLEGFKGKISFTTKVGDVILNVHTVKNTEADNGTQYSDRDGDSYRAFAIYNKDDIQAGLIWIYERQANDPNGLNTALMAPVAWGGGGFVDDPQVQATANILSPYFKATIGDLYLEGEAGWLDGTLDISKCSPAERAFLAAAGVPNDVDLEGLRVYLKAKYNIGSSYVGGLFAFVQGDDPNTAAVENMNMDSGGDWDPMLILFNDTCPTTLGNNRVTTPLDTRTTMTGSSMDNGSIYQVFAGTTMDKISIRSSLSYAKADENATDATGAQYLNKDYGTEFDLEASYKIYDNLTYSAGFGYLWAGDFYKGSVATNKIDDTYLLMNKLQVVF